MPLVGSCVSEAGWLPDWIGFLFPERNPALAFWDEASTVAAPRRLAFAPQSRRS